MCSTICVDVTFIQNVTAIGNFRDVSDYTYSNDLF